MTLPPNPHVAALAPYALADLSAPPGKRLISLAQNESALPPSPGAMEAARAALTDARLYPDPDWCELREAIAWVHGLDPASILCGCGSMELIGALAAAYLGPGNRALTTAYGYLFFRTAARLAGAEIDLAPETGLTVDIDALLGAVRPYTRIVFVANPGNPTGTRITRADLLRLRDRLPGDVLLVIDEAYGEFADMPGEAMFDLAARGDTVVLRTFSKVYGLAAMRVGWGCFRLRSPHSFARSSTRTTSAPPHRPRQPPRCVTRHICARFGAKPPPAATVSRRKCGTSGWASWKAIPTSPFCASPRPRPPAAPAGRCAPRVS
jgi:histidinol-phosphate/aromatic aminotransferase/cobyric acid decarboxylase-like protein